MHFQIYTLFPEMFPGSLSCSLAGKALEKGLWSYKTISLREFATDKRSTADDTPYGGGAGMVLKPDVIGRALDQTLPKNTILVYPTPSGTPLKQSIVESFVKQKNIALLAGRFQGVDERIFDYYPHEKISIGDYVLSGGEIPALVIMDACIRLLKGVMGNTDSFKYESFSHSDTEFSGLLEYPLYTKPVNWKNLSVPEVLLSGHHAEIHQWKIEEAKRITAKYRQDLWQQYMSKCNGKKIKE